MIIQGTAADISLHFDEDMTNNTIDHVSIVDDGSTTLKRFTAAQVTKSSSEVVVSLTPAETKAFPVGPIQVEVYYLSSSKKMTRSVMNEYVERRRGSD